MDRVGKEGKGRGGKGRIGRGGKESVEVGRGWTGSGREGRKGWDEWNMYVLIGNPANLLTSCVKQVPEHRVPQFCGLWVSTDCT